MYGCKNMGEWMECDERGIEQCLFLRFVIERIGDCERGWEEVTGGGRYRYGLFR